MNLKNPILWFIVIIISVFIIIYFSPKPKPDCKELIKDMRVYHGK